MSGASGMTNAIVKTARGDPALLKKNPFCPKTPCLAQELGICGWIRPDSVVRLHRPEAMNLSEFTANYEHFGDDELLSLWAEWNTLGPEASMA